MARLPIHIQLTLNEELIENKVRNRLFQVLATTIVIGGLLLSAGCSSGTAPDTQTNTPLAGTTEPSQQFPSSVATQTAPGVPNQVPSVLKTEGSKPFSGTVILGSPTDISIVVSLLSSIDSEVYIEYGKSSVNYVSQTVINSLYKDQPKPIELSNLEKDTLYYYRVCHRTSGETGFSAGIESTFYTQRATSSTFSFGIQGDSHPERAGKMFDSNLYTVTMNNVKNYKLDFFFTLGDDFSIEGLIEKNQLSQCM